MVDELSFQETEALLESVMNNKKLVKVESQNGDEFIVFSHPCAQDILCSRYVRERALLAAIDEELPTRADIEKVIEERGLLDQEKIIDIEASIKAQERLLNLTKIQGRRKSIEETMAKLIQELYEIKSTVDQLYTLTQEFRADEESILYLTWAATHKVMGKRYWKSFEDFEASKNLILRNSLVFEYSIFNQGLNLKEIRFLARHVLWRIRYTAGLKIGGPLFPQGLHDLTTDQQSLLYWSNYYQSIFEMLPDDQPDDAIIKDDEKLDAYMDSYFKARDQDNNQGRLKRRSGAKGKLSTDASDEVILTTNHPEYLAMSYSEQRVKGTEETSEVEVISPNSRRAKNRRAARRTKETS